MQRSIVTPSAALVAGHRLCLRKGWRAPFQLFLTVAHDPLCDEGRAYATRLEDEGVRVQALHLSDQIHGMLMQGRVVAASETVGVAVADWVGTMMPAQ